MAVAAGSTARDIRAGTGSARTQAEVEVKPSHYPIRGRPPIGAEGNEAGMLPRSALVRDHIVADRFRACPRAK